MDRIKTDGTDVISNCEQESLRILRKSFSKQGYDNILMPTYCVKIFFVSWYFLPHEGKPYELIFYFAQIEPACLNFVSGV